MSTCPEQFLIVLSNLKHPSAAGPRGLVGVDAHHTAPAFDFLANALQWIGGADMAPVFMREGDGPATCSIAHWLLFAIPYSQSIKDWMRFCNKFYAGLPDSSVSVILFLVIVCHSSLKFFFYF